MSGITRYILYQLAGPFLFVTLTLTGIVWLTQSLRFLDLIINKGLSVGGFLYLTLLLLPGFLTIILPIAAFTAILYVYYRMETESEILVMRAAGLSHMSLMRPALLMATGVTALTFLLTLYLMPLGFRTFKDMQFVVRNSFSPVLIQEGTFNNIVTGVTVYVRERSSNGALSGILVHDSRDPERPVTVMAERGMMVSTDEGPRIVLRNGNRQEIELEDGQLSLLYFDSYTFDLGGVPGMGSDRFREPKERYLGELLNPRDVVQDKHRREFWAEAQRRLVTPLHNLVFVLIGLAALLAGEFNRRGQGWRLLGAVGMAVALQAFTLGMTSVIVAAA
ncbi:MAG: LPS export ABC transporter permease LptF, partial [Proteobacteria bacterium]|nr:LPS export ABC transporter permease LptF [Pseudomonadota bacterium]